jgi:Fe-S-cluster containining protein
LFFADGYRIAKEVLGDGISKETILLLQQRIFESIEDFLELFSDQCRQTNQAIACKKGCSWCCSNAVMVLPLEAFYMAEFVNGHFSEKERSAFLASAAKKDEITAKNEAIDFLHFKIPCPFLTDGACAIYEARPMACRLFLSKDVNSCLAEFDSPRNHELFPMLYEFPLRAGRQLNEGLYSFLREKGLEPFEWLLESSILIAFQSGSLGEWLKGANNFQVRSLSEQEATYIESFGKKGI